MFDNPIAIAAVVVIVALLIAGPKRLPSFGRGLGSGMREFKEGIQGEAKEFKEGITGEDSRDEPKGTVSLSPAPSQSASQNGGNSGQSTGDGRQSEPIA